MVVEVRGNRYRSSDSGGGSAPKRRSRPAKRSFRFLSAAAPSRACWGCLWRCSRGTDHQDRALSACLALTNRPGAPVSDGIGCRWALGWRAARCSTARCGRSSRRRLELGQRAAGDGGAAAGQSGTRRPDPALGAPAGGLHERHEGESLVCQPLLCRGPSDVLSRNSAPDDLAEGEKSPKAPLATPDGQRPSGSRSRLEWGPGCNRGNQD